MTFYRVIGVGLVMGVVGCQQAQPPKAGLEQREAAATIQYQAIYPALITGPITVKDIRPDVPEFKREYTVILPRDITMKITIRSSYDSYSGYSLYTEGELMQPDDRWVLFEPERPADKILDRELLPSIEVYCKEILGQDRQFRHSKPNEFTDESGAIWIRKSVEKAK